VVRPWDDTRMCAGLALSNADHADHAQMLVKVEASIPVNP
jgi:hypothetical protein